ncbi:universal stress protein A [Zhongshania antarctica]|uniref:Universal stress protein n=1 Tax=Zhongshania antarctica TaxID=641702 RepID=A0A840R2S7_9GAMM|nr:universal stress protein [Zhongshania antarctica]MBB5187395.1 universal stress protein A [Zhongshania antarctica]
MPNYRRILAAIDLSDEADAVLERAAGMAALHDADLHLLHVVEPLSLAYGGDIPMDFSEVQQQLQQQAESALGKFAQRLNIPKNQCHLLTGRPDAQIHELCESLDADLIIVGSHGRKGLALLLGSTANGVLHGAECDVLAVRVGRED